MGLYNVVAPCVVGGLHYARSTAKPIEVDDKVAAPLVSAGSLKPVEDHPEPGVYVAPTLVAGFTEPYSDPVASEPDPPTRRRKRTED